MEREFDLVVFDWDGTLIDSVRSIVDCTRGAMLDAGLEPRSEAEIRVAIGMGLLDSFLHFYPDVDPARCEHLVEHYRARWLAHHKDRSTLFPGVRPALDALLRSGHFLAVATAKSRRGLERDLALCGLADCFVATRTVDEAPPKPDPGMLLGLMEELGVRPERTLMVGDTTYDLLMATNAATAAVGVLSGSHGAADLATCAPLACLAAATEIPQWLAARAAARRAGEEVRV
jgi:phosphoglycolate phosphatase